MPDFRVRGRAPSVQYISKRGDFKKIVFEDGMALVEVPVALLRYVKFKNDRREESERLSRVERSIRDKGFVPIEPIFARIGRKGRWVIVDGGHRLTAARKVAREFWANLFRQRVYTLYFLLFETPRSWTKTKRRRRSTQAANDNVVAPSLPPPSVAPGPDDDD